MRLTRSAIVAGILWVGGVGLSASGAHAATPLSSGIALESFARLCVDGACDDLIVQQTDTAQDSQASTLDPLLAEVDAVAFSAGLSANSRATLAMNANFTSVSSGSLGFSGFTGIGAPQSSAGLVACTARNNASQGFSYTFVSSTSGEFELDYDFSCMPVEFVTAGAQLEIYWNDVFVAQPGVTASNPNQIGTWTRPILEGNTYTVRIRPNLNGVGGTGCGPPPGWSWSCSGSAAWSFDVAEPVPSPTASSAWGLLLMVAAVTGAGFAALRPR